MLQLYCLYKQSCLQLYGSHFLRLLLRKKSSYCNEWNLLLISRGLCAEWTMLKLLWETHHGSPDNPLHFDDVFFAGLEMIGETDDAYDWETTVCMNLWLRPVVQRSLDDECHPILYATQRGSYRCKIRLQDQTAEVKFSNKRLHSLSLLLGWAKVSPTLTTHTRKLLCLHMYGVVHLISRQYVRAHIVAC